MRLFAPDLYFKSVTAIDLQALKQRGIRHLLLDLDNTLLPRNSSEASAEVIEWVGSLPAEGFLACLVSNNWHSHIHAVAEEIGLPIVTKAIKPFPAAFRKALVRLDASPEDTAVVGDQIFTDVLGGNILGMVTVLVVPLSTSDLPHTLLLRRLERLVLAGRKPLA